MESMGGLVGHSRAKKRWTGVNRCRLIRNHQKNPTYEIAQSFK